MTRKVYPVVPPKLEHKLTALSVSLGAASCGGRVWAAESLRHIEKSRSNFGKKSLGIESRWSSACSDRSRVQSTGDEGHAHAHVRQFRGNMRRGFSLLREASRREGRHDDDARTGPDQSKVSLEMKDAVLHARISVGGTELIGADIPNAQPMRSAYLSWASTATPRPSDLFGSFRRRRGIHADAADVLRTRFGQLRDRFGINWMIIHERPMNAAA